MYLPILVRTPMVEVVAVADVDAGAARAMAEAHHVDRAVRPDELLADPSVEIVVNLTPIVAHVATTQAALAAGKHVYSEKPLATSVEEARALVDEAERRGLMLGCAPDTLLGSGFQTAWAALTDGRIGRPLTVTASMLRRGMSAPSFYTDGPTPFFDMAPYYASALVCLLGPATAVSAATRTWPAGEMPDERPAGASIAVSAVVEFASGGIATLTLGWGIDHGPEVARLDVNGTSGVLACANPNNFGDAAYLQEYGEQEWKELPGSRQPPDHPRNQRGIGVAEMAHALRGGRRARASADLACHVVDLIAGMVRSGETGERVTLTTTCTPPEQLPADVRAQLLT